MFKSILTFLRDDHGVVTVDWTVLSAVAVAMSLATAGALTTGINVATSRMDAELRAQQMNDDFIGFTSSHFEPLYENNLTTAAVAEEVFDLANAMMNQELIDALHYGIQALEAGTLTTEQAVALIAIASVARQRNVVDAEILEYYFGFETGDGRINDLI